MVVSTGNSLPTTHFSRITHAVIVTDNLALCLPGSYVFKHTITLIDPAQLYRETHFTDHYGNDTNPHQLMNYLRIVAGHRRLLTDEHIITINKLIN